MKRRKRFQVIAEDVGSLFECFNHFLKSENGHGAYTIELGEISLDAPLSFLCVRGFSNGSSFGFTSSVMLSISTSVGPYGTYPTRILTPKDYLAKKLHPMDLKAALADELDRLLEPVRHELKGKEKLVKEAYPDIS